MRLVCQGRKDKRYTYQIEKDQTYEDCTPTISMDNVYWKERASEAVSNPLIIVTHKDTGYTFARAVARNGVGTHRQVDWFVWEGGERSRRAVSDTLTRCHSEGTGAKSVDWDGNKQPRSWRSVRARTPGAVRRGETHARRRHLVVDGRMGGNIVLDVHDGNGRTHKRKVKEILSKQVREGKSRIDKFETRTRNRQ